jgi:hypothetical protein
MTAKLIEPFLRPMDSSVERANWRSSAWEADAQPQGDSMVSLRQYANGMTYQAVELTRKQGSSVSPQLTDSTELPPLARRMTVCHPSGGQVRVPTSRREAIMINGGAFALEDFKVPVRLKLFALWSSVMFFYIYGDYFELYQPRQLQAMISGRTPLGLTSQGV